MLAFFWGTNGDRSRSALPDQTDFHGAGSTVSSGAANETVSAEKSVQSASGHSVSVTGAGAMTLPANASGAVAKRPLRDLVVDPDFAHLIAQLYQSADPADWYLAGSLNLWCSTVSAINSDLEASFQATLGADGALLTARMSALRTRCGEAQVAFSAPNSRAGDFGAHNYPWKEARGLSSLQSADASEAERSLRALAENPDLLSAWISQNRVLGLHKAPFMQDVPKCLEDAVLTLATCRASPGACRSDGIVFVATCATSMLRYCGGDNLESSVLRAIPENSRGIAASKSDELLNAMRAGRVDLLVTRTRSKQ